MNGSAGHPTEPLIERLTRREHEILVLLDQGYSAPEIATKLTLAVSSVKWHIQQLYGKLGVNSKRQALTRAKALRLLTPSPTVSSSEPPPSAALRPAAAPRTEPIYNLPLQVTRLFGREDAAAQIRQHLGGYHLVTLTGSGGVGKTRLALQVAEEILGDYRDGVRFVQLAPLSDPALVAQQVAVELSVRDEPGHAILDTLTLFVRDRNLLLVLDNCEHLLEACARLVSSLLLAGSGLRILATSRERLGVAGEANFPVPSLPFPVPGQALSAENVNDYPAVRMFADRASLVRPGYQVTHQNAATVARICQRLDGIPLAIEMAAAWLNVLSAEEIGRRLDDTFGLLTRGDRNALPRQQTLRATFDWSYQLLSVEERRLLQRLSVFGGGCTLDAAEAICSDTSEPATDILNLLATLVDKSVIVADQQPGQATRYRLLETIREYGLERLVASGESEIVRHKHMDFFVDLAMEADPQLTSPLREIGLVTMKVERDNLRAALQWARESGDALAGVQLAGALWLFWFSLGNLREGRGWLEGALAQAKSLDAPAPKVKVLLAAGNLAWFQGDYLAARGLLEEAQAICRRLGVSARRDLAYSLLWLGIVERDLGDLPIARPLLEESVAICRETRDRGTLALGLVSLGRTVVVAGDPATARPILEEGLTIFREFADTWGQALALNNLGLAAFREGAYHRATALFQEGIALFWQVEERVFTVRCIEELAGVTCREGQYVRAARLFGAAETQREAFGASMPPAARVEHDQHLADVHVQLGDPAFATAWAEGRAMTMAQTVEYALANIEPDP